jgi:hypothetical protein
MRTVVLLGGLVFAAAVAAAAQTPQPDKDELTGNAAKGAEFAADEAKRYDLRRADQGKRPFALVPKPLLRWSNPTRGEVHGSVYLWTHDGCPEAISSAYQMFHRKQLNVELVSLSEAALTGKRNDKVRWSPGAGVTFAPLPDAPAPAATPEARRFQMRALAGKFTGHLAERDAPDNLSELRLMNRPLHQYAATDKSGREGAIFAFVTTTDPEIVLLIESRPKGTGREWVWAAARMHYCRLLLKLGDKAVWDVPQAAPPWEKLRGPEGTYVILQWATPEEAAKD